MRSPLASKEWLSPPVRPTLKHREVHLWRLNFEEERHLWNNFVSYLNQSEQEKATRYRFAKDQRRFEMGRGFLRRVLSLYLKLKPEEIQFEWGAYGKPALSSTTHGTELRFNLSHSGQWAILGLTLNCDIGVDIEFEKADIQLRKLGKRFFSPEENAVLDLVPEDELSGAFYRCWTRKEAFIKALGSGLSCPLDQFGVSFDKGQSPALLFTRWNPDEAAKWSMAAGMVATHYPFAVIQKAEITALQYFAFS